MESSGVVDGAACDWLYASILSRASFCKSKSCNRSGVRIDRIGVREQFPYSSQARWTVKSGNTRSPGRGAISQKFHSGHNSPIQGLNRRICFSFVAANSRMSFSVRPRTMQSHTKIQTGSFRVRRQSRKPMQLLLRITMAAITPPIWRLIRVPDRFTLYQLHRVLQSCLAILTTTSMSSSLTLVALRLRTQSPRPEDATAIRLCDLDLSRALLVRLRRRVGT